MTRILVRLILTTREAETIAALLDQEADDLEEDVILDAKLTKTRARYLRSIARKVEGGKA
jgi:3-methyladenine DNA glycosylase/8-oxoguanine DNA glycosylase